MFFSDITLSKYVCSTAAIWGQQEISCISAIQNRACRYFMSVSKYTPIAAVQRDMGLKTAGHRKKLCAKYIISLFIISINMLKTLFQCCIYICLLKNLN